MRFKTGVKAILHKHYILRQCINIVDLDFWRFKATFSNISAIPWRPVVVVEEAGVPGITLNFSPMTFCIY
jgi:hypothetical protein